MNGLSFGATAIKTAPAPLAGLPAINLMPGDYAAGRAQRRRQLAMALAVLATLGAVGAGMQFESGKVNQARTDLASEQTTVASLQREANSYLPVTQAARAVDQARSTLRAALGGEVRWSRFLAQLSRTVPSTVQITTMSFTLTPATGKAPAAGGASATGGNVPGLTPVAHPIGTLSISGMTRRQSDVANWLDAIGRQLGIATPYLTTSTRDGAGGVQRVKFDSTAVLTDDLLSKRYTDAEAGLR